VEQKMQNVSELNRQSLLILDETYQFFLHLRNISVKLKFRGIISQGKALDWKLSFAFIIFYI